MAAVDIIILIFLLIGAVSGFRKGLLMEIVSIGAFFIAMILATKLMDWGIMMLSDHIEGYEKALPIISFIIIFITVILIVHFVGKALKKVLDLTLLGSLDDIAGSLLGIIKWAIIISVLLWIYSSFGGQLDDQYTEGSILYSRVVSFAPWLFQFVSELFPYFKEFFDQSGDLVNQPKISA